MTNWVVDVAQSQLNQRLHDISMEIEQPVDDGRFLPDPIDQWRLMAMSPPDGTELIIDLTNSRQDQLYFSLRGRQPRKLILRCAADAQFENLSMVLTGLTCLRNLTESGWGGQVAHSTQAARGILTVTWGGQPATITQVAMPQKQGRELVARTEGKLFNGQDSNAAEAVNLTATDDWLTAKCAIQATAVRLQWESNTNASTPTYVLSPSLCDQINVQVEGGPPLFGIAGELAEQSSQQSGDLTAQLQPLITAAYLEDKTAEFIDIPLMISSQRDGRVLLDVDSVWQHQRHAEPASLPTAVNPFHHPEITVPLVAPAATRQVHISGSISSESRAWFGVQPKAAPDVIGHIALSETRQLAIPLRHNLPDSNDWLALWLATTSEPNEPPALAVSLVQAKADGEGPGNPLAQTTLTADDHYHSLHDRTWLRFALDEFLSDSTHALNPDRSSWLVICGAGTVLDLPIHHSDGSDDAVVLQRNASGTGPWSTLRFQRWPAHPALAWECAIDPDQLGKPTVNGYAPDAQGWVLTTPPAQTDTWTGTIDSPHWWQLDLHAWSQAD